MENVKTKSNDICWGIHDDFLYNLQQRREEQNLPLLHLMVVAKYLGVTATATGANCAPVSVSVADAVPPFLSATETSLVAPKSAKKILLAKNGKIFLFF